MYTMWTQRKKNTTWRQNKRCAQYCFSSLCFEIMTGCVLNVKFKYFTDIKKQTYYQCSIVSSYECYHQNLSGNPPFLPKDRQLVHKE